MGSIRTAYTDIEEGGIVFCTIVYRNLEPVDWVHWSNGL